jgi:hypothetical protein
VAAAHAKSADSGTARGLLYLSGMQLVRVVEAPRHAWRRPLAIVAVAVGLGATGHVWGNGPTRTFSTDKASIAVLALDMWIEDYAEWRHAHPGSRCPVDIAQLANGEIHDPWGREFRITCTAHGIAIRSAGPDRQFGTRDDIERGSK